MIKIVLPLFALCIISCKNTETSIPLFNGAEFNLEQGEESQEIDINAKNNFQNYFLEGQNFQIPLYRYITSKDYKIYIGIPYGMTIADIGNNKLANQDSSTVKIFTDSISYCFKSHELPKAFLSEYALRCTNDNIVYILGMTHSKDIASSKFNKEELNKRITQNNSNHNK